MSHVVKPWDLLKLEEQRDYHGALEAVADAVDGMAEGATLRVTKPLRKNPGAPYFVVTVSEPRADEIEARVDDWTGGPGASRLVLSLHVTLTHEMLDEAQDGGAAARFICEDAAAKLHKALVEYKS
jgi:hypothetical protein